MRPIRAAVTPIGQQNPPAPLAKTVGFARENSKKTELYFARTKASIFRCCIWYILKYRAILCMRI
jgi:hypothetical protein